MIEQEDVSHGVIEDDEVLEDMQEYNQVVMVTDQMANQEGEETLATQCVENQVGGEENSLFIYQVEEQVVDQSACHLVVEDSPDQTGTFKVSIIQVTQEE